MSSNALNSFKIYIEKLLIVSAKFVKFTDRKRINPYQFFAAGEFQLKVWEELEKYRLDGSSHEFVCLFVQEVLSIQYFERAIINWTRLHGHSVVVWWIRSRHCWTSGFGSSFLVLYVQEVVTQPKILNRTILYNLVHVT